MGALRPRPRCCCRSRRVMRMSGEGISNCGGAATAFLPVTGGAAATSAAAAAAAAAASAAAAAAAAALRGGPP